MDGSAAWEFSDFEEEGERHDSEEEGKRHAGLGKVGVVDAEYFLQFCGRSGTDSWRRTGLGGVRPLGQTPRLVVGFWRWMLWRVECLAGGPGRKVCGPA